MLFRSSCSCRLSKYLRAVIPFWNMLFGTADFSNEYPPTGGKRAPESMATGGYFAQQLGGLQFFMDVFRTAARVAAHDIRQHSAPEEWKTRALPAR